MKRCFDMPIALLLQAEILNIAITGAWDEESVLSSEVS